MPILIATFDEALALAQGWVQSEFPDENLADDSYHGKWARVLAMLYWADQAALQDADSDWPPSDNSSTAALDAMAELLGLPNGAGGFGRLVATPASGGLGTITGTKGTVYAANLQLTGPDGVTRFKLAAAETIPGVAPATILEHSRAALTGQHSYGCTTGAYAGGASTSFFATIADSALASQFGARLTVVITTTMLSDVTFTLVAPDGTTKTWTGFPLGAGSSDTTLSWYLYAPSMAGAQVSGTWTLTITSAAAGGLIDAGTMIFVEGIGRAPGGPEGLAANLFEWAALVDESMVAAATYGRDVARQIVQRWNPAHCRGYLAVKATGGSPYGVFDDPSSVFDGCLFGT